MSQSSYSQAPRIPTCPSRLRVVRKSVSLRGQRGDWNELRLYSGCRNGAGGPVIPPRGHHPHPSPETRKGAEERPGRHAHGATHHKAHLHAVEATWLGLSIGTHGHRHLRDSKIRKMQAWPPSRKPGGDRRKRGWGECTRVRGSSGRKIREESNSITLLAFGSPIAHLTSLAASVAQIYVSHGTPGGAHSWPEECFRGAGQYFRESAAKDCNRLGIGAVPSGRCCCERLGGGWLRRCPQFRARGPRRPLGVCACAVRPRVPVAAALPEGADLTPLRFDASEIFCSLSLLPAPQTL